MTMPNITKAFSMDQRVKYPPANAGNVVQFLSQEGPLEEEMTTHSSKFAWRIPRIEKPEGLQSKGSQRVR